MTERELLIAWPGVERTQRAMWSFLQVVGLAARTKHCQQLDAYDLRIPLVDGLERSVRRDWHPDEPTHGYWDYEPPNWLWDSRTDGYSDADVSLVGGARDGVAEWQAARGSSMRAGIYGIPVIPRGEVRSFRLTDHAHFLDARRVLTGWDWVLLSLYPPDRGDLSAWMDDTEAHALRAATNYTVACEVYGAEVVPFLHVTPAVDAARYAAVYTEALANAGCKRLGLWVDLRDDAHALRGILTLAQMTPALRRFTGGD